MKITSAQDLAAAVRGRRITMGLSQGDLAVRAGVSRPWLSKVETGKPTTEFGLIIRLLDVLGLSMDLVESDRAEGDCATTSVNLDDLLEEYRDR